MFAQLHARERKRLVLASDAAPVLAHVLEEMVFDELLGWRMVWLVLEHGFSIKRSLPVEEFCWWLSVAGLATCDAIVISWWLTRPMRFIILRHLPQLQVIIQEWYVPVCVFECITFHPGVKLVCFVALDQFSLWLARSFYLLALEQPWLLYLVHARNSTPLAAQVIHGRFHFVLWLWSLEFLEQFWIQRRHRFAFCIFINFHVFSYLSLF